MGGKRGYSGVNWNWESNSSSVSVNLIEVQDGVRRCIIRLNDVKEYQLCLKEQTCC